MSFSTHSCLGDAKLPDDVIYLRYEAFLDRINGIIVRYHHILKVSFELGFPIDARKELVNTKLLPKTLKGYTRVIHEESYPDVSDTQTATSFIHITDTHQGHVD